MKKEDVLLRADELLIELYEEINIEDWAQDDRKYDEYMNDFFIITNILSELIQHRYNNSTSNKDFKKSVMDIIDYFLK